MGFFVKKFLSGTPGKPWGSGTGALVGGGVFMRPFGVQDIFSFVASWWDDSGLEGSTMQLPLVRTTGVLYILLHLQTVGPNLT